MPLVKHNYTSSDLPKPFVLRRIMNALGGLIDVLIDKVSVKEGEKVINGEILSLRQLLVDLGEGITRCELPETYISTSLYMFWAADELIRSYLKPSDKEEARKEGRTLLWNYVASVLLFEKYVT